MIAVFLAVYGWIIAAICAACWWHTERRLKQALHREELYITMVGDRYQDLKPSIAALKAARIIPPVILLLCLPLTPSCASSRMGKSLDVAVVLTSTADYVTTRQALDSGRGREGNALLGQGAARQAVLKAAGTTGVILLADVLEQKHRITAHVVRMVLSALWTSVAIHNAGVGR